MKIKAKNDLEGLESIKTAEAKLQTIIDNRQSLKMKQNHEDIYIKTSKLEIIMNLANLFKCDKIFEVFLALLGDNSEYLLE